MSLLEVNKITPQSGTTLTLGDTGDTINFGSGVLPNFENLTVTGDLTVDTNSLKVDSTNNYVGIGTASPSYPLHIVNSSGGFDSVIEATDTTTFLSLVASDGSVGFGAVGAGQIQFRVGGDAGSPNGQSEAMRITSAGNVGIGTSSPSSFAGYTTLGINNATNGGLLELQNSGTTYGQIFTDGTNFNIRSSASATALIFDTNGANERMRIDSSGRVGIGVAPTGSWQLQVAGSSSNSRVRMQNTTTGFADGDGGSISMEGNDFLLQNSETGVVKVEMGGSERMRIDSSGRLLIGTTDIGYSGFGDDLTIGSASGNNGMTIRSGTADFGTIYFSDATGTGSGTYAGKIQYYHSDNSMRFGTNSTGSEVMRIDSSGNVGIGVTSMTNKLVLPNASYFAMQDTSNLESLAIRANTSNAMEILTGGSVKMTIDSSGKVGIGTTSPIAPLHAYNATSNEIARFQSGDEYVHIVFQDSTTTNAPYIGAQGNHFRIITGGAERLKVHSEGYTELKSGDAYSQLVLTPSGTNAPATINFNTPGSGRARFKVQNNEYMTILSNGDVGIGTSSPQTKLHIADGTGGTSLEINPNDASELVTVNAYDRASSAWRNLQLGGTDIRFYCLGAETMRIDSSGNVLVGKTSSGAGNRGVEFTNLTVANPRQTITSTGTGAETKIEFRNGNGYVGEIYTNGSSTIYLTSSDYRLKENVVDLTSATDRLKQLQPKRFNFIADINTTVDGFLAHEVSDIVPEAIKGTHNEVDDEGNPIYQGIDQSKLVPLLVASLQEAMQKIEDLEARVDTLEGN